MQGSGLDAEAMPLSAEIWSLTVLWEQNGSLAVQGVLPSKWSQVSRSMRRPIDLWMGAS